MGRSGLLATTYRGAERRAASELLAFLREAGDEEAEARPAGLPGIVLASVNVDPLRVVDHLYEVVEGEPWRIRYLLRVIPLEELVPADVPAIVEAAGRLASKIGEGETFKVLLERRGAEVERTSLIRAVAEAVKGKVRLEGPDWVVLVEVVGGQAGVSVIRERYIFSSVRAKREVGLGGAQP